MAWHSDWLIYSMIKIQNDLHNCCSPMCSHWWRYFSSRKFYQTIFSIIVLCADDRDYDIATSYVLFVVANSQLGTDSNHLKGRIQLTPHWVNLSEKTPIKWYVQDFSAEILFEPNRQPKRKIYTIIAQITTQTVNKRIFRRSHLFDRSRSISVVN